MVSYMWRFSVENPQVKHTQSANLSPGFDDWRSRRKREWPKRSASQWHTPLLLHLTRQVQLSQAIYRFGQILQVFPLEVSYSPLNAEMGACRKPLINRDGRGRSGWSVSETGNYFVTSCGTPCR
jgi:hypothetical protein